MSELGLHPTLAIEELCPGNVIAERYELRVRLGLGAMGIVWRALDRELDEEIALKMLSSDHEAMKGSHERFRREVKLARRVTHPNIARTYDLGRHDGQWFFTMELIEGESLGKRMQTPVPLAESLRIVSEVCRGLAAAHAQGVVHRDLKPDNVMLAGERVVIADFGIAHSDRDGLATMGSIVGTPAYMAPEQLDAHGVDGRADVYALGIVLFELVTHTLPFRGDTPFAVAAARLGGPAPDPRTIVSTVPDGVATLIRDLLALKREDRPDAQTALSRVDLLRGVGAAVRAPAFPTRASMIFGDVSRDGHEVRIEDFAAGPDAERLGSDLALALRDSLVSERGVRLVSAGGDIIVGGEVRVANGRARARVRLSNKSGGIEWASRAEADASDPFALEDALVAEVRPVVQARTTRQYGPRDESLRAAWEKAREDVATIDPASVRKGIAQLEDLARQAPNDTAVQSLLGRALVALWLQTGAEDPALAARGEELALRALDANSRNADAYAAVSLVRGVFGDHRVALSAAREALSIAPTFAEGHDLLGKFLCDTGHLEEGIQRLEVALRLQPNRAATTSSLLRARALLGEEANVREALSRYRQSPIMRSLLPLCTEFCVWWNDRALASDTADMIESARSGASWEMAIPLLRAFAGGSPDEIYDVARKSFAEGPRMRRSTWTRSKIGMVSATYYTYIGKFDEAWRDIESTVSQPPFVELSWLDRVPTLAPLRTDPRFAAARALVAARVADLGL